MYVTLICRAGTLPRMKEKDARNVNANLPAQMGSQTSLVHVSCCDALELCAGMNTVLHYRAIDRDISQAQSKESGMTLN